MKKLILASKSPRRIELFEKYGIKADSIPADIDESVAAEIHEPSDIVKYLSEKKAKHILGKFPETVVIAADTLVICDDNMLGKPKDKNDAYNMMRLLSGRSHKVISGICAASSDKCICESVETEVSFRELSEDEILGYISTNDPYDKAGGYGIQSLAGAFVRSINGDYYNVVGLPVSRLVEILRDSFGYDAMNVLFSAERVKE